MKIADHDAETQSLRGCFAVETGRTGGDFADVV